MPRGIVKRVIAQKGFGFIEGERGDDLFFHHSELQNCPIESLQEGEVLEYTVGAGKKGPCATALRRVD